MTDSDNANFDATRSDCSRNGEDVHPTTVREMCNLRIAVDGTCKPSLDSISIDIHVKYGG